MIQKKLIEYFKKTSYGEDTRSIAKNIKQWLLDRKIEASVKKITLGMKNTGNRVFIENRNLIKIEIIVKERFDLNDFSKQFQECTFKCDVPQKIFPQSYQIHITINGTDLFDHNGNLKLNTKYRDGICTENMIWLNALDGISFDKSFKL